MKYNVKFSVYSKTNFPDYPDHNQTTNEKALNYIGRTTRIFRRRLYEHTHYVNDKYGEHFGKSSHRVHILLSV